MPVYQVTGNVNYYVDVNIEAPTQAAATKAFEDYVAIEEVNSGNGSEDIEWDDALEVDEEAEYSV